MQLAATETNFHELTLLDVSENFKVSFKSSSTPVFHTHAQLQAEHQHECPGGFSHREGAAADL